MKRFSIKAAVLTVSAVIVLISSCGHSYAVSCEDDLADFLESKGITVTGDCAEKTVTIPDEFGEVYERYNELQKEGGFDLTPYRSREAVVYTYSVAAVNGQPSDFTEVHIMVCDGIIIGGDLASTALDGKMSALP